MYFCDEDVCPGMSHHWAHCPKAEQAPAAIFSALNSMPGLPADRLQAVGSTERLRIILLTRCLSPAALSRLRQDGWTVDCCRAPATRGPQSALGPLT